MAKASRPHVLLWILIFYCSIPFVSPVHFENERRLAHDVEIDIVSHVLDVEFQKATEDETKALVAEVLRVTGCSICRRLMPKSPKFEKKLVEAGWDRWYRCDCKHAAGGGPSRERDVDTALQQDEEQQHQQPQVTGRGTLTAVHKLREYVDQGGLGLVGLRTVSPEYKTQQAEWNDSEYNAALERAQSPIVVSAEPLPVTSSFEEYNLALQGSKARVLQNNDKKEKRQKRKKRQMRKKTRMRKKRRMRKNNMKKKKRPKLPNDPLLQLQTNFETINLYPAWKKMDRMGWGRKKDVATVHILDSGIDTNHEDLGGNLWVNKQEKCGNNKDDDNNNYVDDCHGWNFANKDSNLLGSSEHGSSVAGIIAANTNNNIGITGICGGGATGKSAKLMIGVFNGYPDSNGNPVSGGNAEGLVYAALNGADVSSNSWGYVYPGVGSVAVLRAIDYAVANGVIVVFSAGNFASAADTYPAFYHNVIAVSATYDNKQAVPFTSFGRWVDVAAPGYNVLSTGKAKSEYVRVSGTSFSAPHASGVLAMGKMYKPSASPNELKSCLLSSAQEIGSIQENQAAYGGLNLGYGMIDAHAFLKCLRKKNKCGNGIIENGEVCDWFELGQDLTCLKLGPEYIGGKIRCADCERLDFSGCMKAYNVSTLNIDPDSEVVVTVEISPPKTGMVVVRIAGGSGSNGAGLFVSKGLAPTPTQYQCRSTTANTNYEDCTLSGSGTYHVLVHNEDQTKSITGMQLIVFADGAL